MMLASIGIRLATVRILRRQKKTGYRFAHDVAGGELAVRGRAGRHGLSDPLGQRRLELDNDPATTSGYGSDTHVQRIVATRPCDVNTVPARMQQSVAMPENMLGAKIRELRGDRTQKEIGDLVGLSRARVGHIEKGRVKWPDVELFNAFARALRCPVTVLFRAAGATIPGSTTEDLEWTVSQMDEEGVRELALIAHALLPLHRQRPETVEEPPQSQRAAS